MEAILPIPPLRARNVLPKLTTGGANTAIGFDALFNTTTGGFNTANGAVALFSNTTGGENTATGYGAAILRC